MVAYIQSYIDVCTDKVSADANTKAHFKAMLQLEIGKIEPLVTECKAKGVDISALAPELMQDYRTMVQAIKLSEIDYKPATLHYLNAILF
jgi:hypothetical protein